MPHQDFLDLFKEDTGAVSMLKGDADALKATKKALEHALVRYQDGELQTNAEDKTPYWDFLRRHLSQEQDFAIILALASRHSLAWTNQFIESLVQYNADTQTFTVNTQRLKTLIFLQKHCGLQGRDLSVITSPYTLPEDVRLFERPIEGETFHQNLLDEVYDFLKKLKDSDAMNWAMYLVKQGFLNFSMLHKKIALEEKAFCNWLTQWANQCHIANEMMAERSWEAAYKANDSLEASQCTIRHMVRYGLSPKWLKENAILSANGATHTTSNTTVASNVTFDSALAYHQSLKVNVYQNTGHAPLEQPSNNNAEPTLNNTPKWLKTYTDPEDQYILCRLQEVLSLNEEPALERLKFYHDYGRLKTLIQQVREGQLSLAEVAEYDKPVYEKQKEAIAAHYAAYMTKVNEPFIEKIGLVTSRKLPRLLIGGIDADSSAFSLSKMAEYDMFDENPKNNPTRKITFPGKPHLQKIFEAHEQYLDDIYSKVIIPLAKERVRLYRDWYRLNKKVTKNPGCEYSTGFFGSLYRTPHDEMKLLQEKIALFSGMLKDQCINLKHLEITVADNKKEGKLPPKDLFVPSNMFHYELLCQSEHVFSDGSDLESRFDPRYQQELRGMVSAADLNTVTIKRISRLDLDKNGCVRYFKEVTSEARDYVGSFIKRVIGDLLMLPAVIVTAVASPLKITPPLFASRFCGTFFETKSHYATYRATEVAHELAKKRIAKDEKVRSDAEKEANKDLDFLITSRLS